VLLAVEILSTGTRRIDRVLEFSEYADAGKADLDVTGHRIEIDLPALTRR
jgi:hypothetical protein